MLNKINTEIKNAMIAKDASKRDVLRAIKSSATLIAKEKHEEINDDHVMVAIKKEIKLLKGTVASLAGNPLGVDASEDAKYRIYILEQYLPSMMSQDDVKAEVDRILKDKSDLDMRQAMKFVMGELAGKADGKIISSIVSMYLRK